MPPTLPPARCALAAPFHPCPRSAHPGGLLSVALSLGSPPPDVIRRRVRMEPGLSSARKRRPSGRLAEGHMSGRASARRLGAMTRIETAGEGSCRARRSSQCPFRRFARRPSRRPLFFQHLDACAAASLAPRGFDGQARMAGRHCGFIPDVRTAVHESAAACFCAAVRRGRVGVAKGRPFSANEADERR